MADTDSEPDDPLHEGTRELVAVLDRIEHDGLSEDLFDPVERGEGEEIETWFDAEALAAASTVQLGEQDEASFEAGVLARGPTRADLERAAGTPRISLDRLPGWHDAGPWGQGWGPTIEGWLEPIRPGFVLAMLGRELEGPRRVWLAQLADGLALRDDPGQPLTPVLRLSEEPPLHLRARTLARWAGLCPRRFLGRAADASSVHEPADVLGTARARAALDACFAGPWREIDRLQRSVLPSQVGDPQTRPRVLAALERWRRALSEEHEREVWPVVIVDDLDALGPVRDASLRTLAELAELHGLIVLAGAERQADPIALDRWLDARIILSQPPTAEGLSQPPTAEGLSQPPTAEGLSQPPTAEGLHPHELALGVELAHRRLGAPARTWLAWDRTSGRIEWTGGQAPERS